MNRGLIALALISLLALLVIGCKATAPGVPVGTSTGAGNTETPATGSETGSPANGGIGTAIEKPVESSITGDIKDVDSLNSELNSSDLQNIDSLLNEVNW